MKIFVEGVDHGLATDFGHPVSNLATKLDMKNTCPYSLNGYRRLSGEFESLLLRQVGASFVSLAPTFFKSQSALIPLLLLFRKRSRSRRLFACKRAHDGFGSLPTFCGDAGRLHLFRSTLPRRSKVRFAPAYFLQK